MERKVILLNYITERSKKILFKIASDGKCTIKDIKNYIGVSERTIYSDLQEIEKFVEKYNVKLIRKPRIGIWIEGKNNEISEILTDIIKENIQPDELYKDRKSHILFELFNTSKYITINDLADRIFVSRGIVENELIEIRSFLEKNNLILEKKPSKGVRVVGDEKCIRLAIVELFSNNKNNLIVEYGDENNADIINNNLSNDVKDIFISIDIKAVIDIVDELVKLNELYFTDTSYNSLVINLIVAIERIKLGNFISFDLNIINKLKSESEYKLANRVSELINSKFKIGLFEEEICYITVLLLSLRVQKKIIDLNEKNIDKSFNEFIELCDNGIKEASKVVNINFENDTYLKEELYIHIKAMINRLTYGINVENYFTTKIKTEYCTAFEAALVFKKLINKEYRLDLSVDEIAYIALHFQVSIEKIRSEIKRTRIAIVCSIGVGNAHLIAMKINRLIPELEIVNTLSVIDLIDRKLDVDFILSTVPIFKSTIPVVEIKPFIAAEDIVKIREATYKVNNSIRLNEKKNFFKSLISKSWIFPNLKGLNQKEILKKITEKLEKDNMVNEGYLQSLLLREELESTAFLQVAIPHANPDYVKKSIISICTLEEKIQWGDQYVDIIFLLTLSKNDYSKLQKIFEYFYYLIEDRELILRIKNATSSKEIYNIII